MNIDAKAREVASKIQKDCKAYIPLECDAIIAAALLAVRNEALEEAAKVADDYATEMADKWRATHKSDSHLEGACDAGDDIATAIRALRRP